MQYNSKSSSSALERAIADGKEIKKTTIRIWEIQRKVCKTGDYVVTLLDSDTGHTKYSNFESIWNAQNIDILTLEEGQEMDVWFCFNNEYRNFLKVEVVQQGPF